jgi:hypothetical protein
MTLPEGVSIKLGLYTLACRQLLNRLLDLHAATQADLRLDYMTCLQRFDEALHVFFERSSANDPHQAAKQFGDLLHAQASLFRDSNQRAADIFDDVVAAIHNQAPSWCYETDLERFHIQGRDFARHFFADSPWRETQARLDRECQLTIEYGAPADDDRIAMLAEPFGYRAAPLAYYPSRWNDEQEQNCPDVVLARFAFGHDFTLYLAYPFLFLHEYTAHAYALDHSNERFNDGWMLHAAAAFLTRKWNKTPEQFELNCKQASVFYECLFERLGKHDRNYIPRQACWFAWEFDDWLHQMHLPERFMQMTHELAAFQPRPGEQVHWPTQFINALEHEFVTDRKRLLRKIQTSTDVRELMMTLSHV